jgi:tetratricopeptide (TPR) repeat protein
MPPWTRSRRGSSRARGAAHEIAARHAAGIDLWRAGRAEEAVPLLEDALAGCLSGMGEDDPATLTVAGNLGAVCFSAGAWQQGLDLLAASVADRTRTFGPSDPRTLTAVDALATAYRLVGRIDEAVALSEGVAAERTPAPPDTLTSRLGAALARAAFGDIETALALLAAALGDAEQAHGSRHEHAIALRANLAGCLALLGRAAEAAAELQRAATDAAALFGRAHPETEALLADLAHADDRSWFFAIGRMAGEGRDQG